MIYSKIYQEYERGEEFKWTEALMHGLIGAVSVGSGLLAGKTIFTNRGAVPANLENAAVEQLNVQQTLPFCIQNDKFYNSTTITYKVKG